MAMLRGLVYVILLPALAAAAQTSADPQSIREELSLANAYAQRFIPGIQSEENRRLAEMALEGFQKVLKVEPNNTVAIAGLANIYQNTGQFMKAREFSLRRAELSPLDARSFYAVAVVDWIIVSNKSAPEMPETQDGLIEEGLRYLDIALAIDPDYDEAMAYKNLLFRQKATRASSEVEKSGFIAEADRWFEKALATRKKNQQTKQSLATGLAPPPPPPPPPPHVIRMSPSAIERNLLFRPQVVYPPLARQARIQGSVVLEAFINKDGAVQNLRVISGHPLLVQAAVENAKLWRFTPILLNGQPTEVVTSINVDFQLR